MLFDIRGKRRRAVQATYLTLALLMGGGLVLFGIGGDVSGGLFDAFSDRSGGDGNEQVEQRIERNEERLQANPRNQRALKELVRDHFQLATSQLETGTVEYPDDARDELQGADRYWRRYLEGDQKRPDASLASVALQVYDVGALNRPKEAQEAASIMAEQANDSASYLRLVSYAALSGDKRTADLAAQKAIDLAPKGERKLVEQQAEQLRKSSSPAQVQGG